MGYVGLNGLELQTNSALPLHPLAGLLGISIEIEGNLPVKVIDRRGRGLENVKITAANPGGIPNESFTDSLGNGLLVVNAANPNPITVVKNNASLTVNFTTGDQFVITLEPPSL